MANEFVHGSVGTSLTQVEFEAVGLHVLNSQATGDLIYASSSSQLSRLGIGTTNKVLTVIGGVPAWQSTLVGLTLTSPTINGTIATTGLTLPAVTLGGTMTVTGYALDAGAGSAQINTTGSLHGLSVISTQDGTNGVKIQGETVSASPANGDAVVRFHGRGRDAGNNEADYAAMQFKIEDNSSGASSGMIVWNCWAATAMNETMHISSAGVLAVDLAGSGTPAQVDLFDEYDDALVIRQGIQENNRELLADIGVLDRKDTGSGYMMKIQPMVRLLAGGIYQGRAMIDELQNRIEGLENKLMLLGAG